MKTLQFKFILPVLIGILAISCKKTDSEDLKPGTPISQYYSVKYHKYNNETKATAFFRIRKNDSDVKLTEDSFVTFNGEKDQGYNIILNQYRWKSKEKTDVSFVYQKGKGKVFTNTVKETDIASIAIPASIKEYDLKKSLVIKWIGDPIGDNEKIVIQINQKDVTNRITYNKLVKGEKQIEIVRYDDIGEGFKAGEADFYLRRVKSYSLDSQDQNAGGEMVVIFEDMKKVMIK